MDAKAHEPVRDADRRPACERVFLNLALLQDCLLYTSDAADDLLCVDLGGRRIIKKKKTTQRLEQCMLT